MNQRLANTEKIIREEKSRLKVFAGQKFDLLIHSACMPERFIEGRDERGFSTSIIDDKNICCYRPLSVKFAFYGGLLLDELFCASIKDNVSARNGEFWEAYEPSDFMPYETFKKSTRDPNKGREEGYSELIIEAHNSLIPHAVVCFDYITDYEYKIAQDHNLDIILILTEMYPGMRKNSDRERAGIGKKIDIDISRYTQQSLEKMK